MYDLSLPYQLRTGDFDRFGRIQPAAVLDVFQDIASVQAADMGIGYSDACACKAFWAVARMKYEVVAPPRIHEVVQVRTWPHSPSRFAFQRDYSMHDGCRRLLVKATAEWVLMDIAARTLRPIADIFQGTGEFSPDRMFAKRVRKLKDVDYADAAGEVTRVLRASDVDVNGHVNNARYGAYVLDALDLGANEAVRAFQIDFRRELRQGDEVRIKWLRSEPEAQLRSASDVQALSTREVQPHRAFVRGMNERGEVAFASAVELAAPTR